MNPGVILIGILVAILAILGCKALTKGFLRLTKKLVLWTKRLFLKKEGNS